MTLSPSRDDLLPETVERLPYPIGFCWTQARSSSFLVAAKCAEYVVRTMCALVLADVVDVPWNAHLQAALDEGKLSKPPFGTRVDLLGLLVEAHEAHLGRPGVVLPSLAAWWDKWAKHLRALVECRNDEVHGSVIVEEPTPDRIREALAEVLRAARWLQQVQVVVVKSLNPTPDGTGAELLRLRGSASNAMEGSLRVRFARSAAAQLTVGTVYMGRADGTAWRQVSGMRRAVDAQPGRVVEVFDGVEKGRARFMNPSSEQAVHALHCLHLPSNAEPLLWPDFVARRQSATWTLLEPHPHPGLVLRDLPLDLAAAPGKEVHGYRLVKSLGEGRRSCVWEAHDKATRDQYALKFLRGKAAESSTEGHRLEREIHWLKRLKCRRVVGPVERVGSPDARDGLLLRMPRYRSSLAARAEALRNSLSPEAMETQVRRWAVQALEALEAVHGEGVVHRDVCAENFLVDDHDELVLADFGSASAPLDMAESGEPTLTRVGKSTGFRVGPEARDNPSEATPASDIHAVAGALRSVLGRVQPGPELQQLLHAMAAPDPAQRPTASEALARMRALLSPGVPAGSASLLPTAHPASPWLPTAPAIVPPASPPANALPPNSAPSVAAQLPSSPAAPVPSAPAAVPVAVSAPQPPRAPAAPPPPAPSSAFAVPASAGVVFGPSPTPYPLPPGHAPAPRPASPPAQSAFDARTPPPVAPPTHPPQLARSGAPSAAPASLGKWVAAGVVVVGLAAGAIWAAGAGGKRSVSPREPMPASTARPATTAPARPLAPPSCPDGMVGLAGATVTLSAPEGATDPSRAVAVAPLCIDRTEVTVAAYAACVGRGQCTRAASGDHCNEGDQARLDHPANCVVWRQADAYCRAQGKRLPTSDEWEYAARGLDGREFPWGSAPPTGRVCGGPTGTCAVASTPSGASPSGALDMAGNVHEWTSTRASSNDGLHEYRGGSWTEKGLLRLRAALRAKAGPDHQRPDIGFRCARSASP
jgi:formylglycine-generating enzyme required for sulfatase activity